MFMKSKVLKRFVGFYIIVVWLLISLLECYVILKKEVCCICIYFRIITLSSATLGRCMFQDKTSNKVLHAT